MASEILEEKSITFKAQNRESIQEILSPLQKKIAEFEQKVDSTNKEAIDRNAALREQIMGLKDINLLMSKEATNLTKALKGDSKTQGNWGELVLERVLEKSGLEKGREYELEQSFDTKEEGKTRFRPDVVIHLPGGKKMIIDSKVTLTAYERYINQEDPQLKEVDLKMHLSALNQRIKELSEKNYSSLLEGASPDFVLLFIPIEPAFALALNHDNQLYNKAFEQNIIIVTPTTLLATLRTIDTMWNNEKQQRNALEIAQQAGFLYDKFESLTQDLIKIGKKMDETKDEYKGAMNKLFQGKGNLIARVEKLKSLGVKAKKSISSSLVDRALEFEVDQEDIENKL
ncbi:MAG: DNA recombination protein RmuC [Flavobacteriaceae bacterium]|nr:MAG: DNA recombination protein RmuC [Flavobacteriaceae bacterium]